MKRLAIICAFSTLIINSGYGISWDSTIGRVTDALKIAPAALDLGGTVLKSGGTVAAQTFKIAAEVQALDAQLGISKGIRATPEQVRDALPAIFEVISALSSITLQLGLIFEKSGGIAEVLNKNVGGQISKAGIVLRQSLEILDKIINTVNSQMPEIIKQANLADKAGVTPQPQKPVATEIGDFTFVGGNESKSF